MIYELSMKLLDEYVAGQHRGNVSAAARALGMKTAAFSRWVNRERTPNAEDLSTILDRLGARLLPPNSETGREVCFVDSRVVNEPEGGFPLPAEDYLAVPLISEAGAGPGIIPINEQESWFLVYRNEPSIRMRSNLIAVRIARGSTSMEPTLHPGDIVLVDRNDRVVSKPGNIWLVMDPDGAGKVKRVKIDIHAQRRETLITYYSDNVLENPPEIYSLERDFESDLERVIVGRVIWAWSDISSK